MIDSAEVSALEDLGRGASQATARIDCGWHLLVANVVLTSAVSRWPLVLKPTGVTGTDSDFWCIVEDLGKHC